MKISITTIDTIHNYCESKFYSTLENEEAKSIELETEDFKTLYNILTEPEKKELVTFVRKVVNELMEKSDLPFFIKEMISNLLNYKLT
jgi:hypothetical protein